MSVKTYTLCLDQGIIMAWIYKVTNKLGQMTLADMQNNANEIYAQLTEAGWTLNAISAVLGNMAVESSLNPAQTQYGYPTTSLNGGYGLVQWTPASKYKNWANQLGVDITDGYWQLLDLDTQAHGVEYIMKSAYPLTYSEFKTSEDTPAYLTEVFLKNYERAGVEALSKRVEWANYWYEFLSGVVPPSPPTPPKPTIKKKGMPVYMMIRYF